MENSNRGLYDGIEFVDKEHPLINNKYNGGSTRFFRNHRKISAIKIYPYNDISHSKTGVPCTDVTVMYKNGNVLQKTFIKGMTLDDAHMMYHYKLNLFEKLLSFFGKEINMRTKEVDNRNDLS